MLTSSEADSFDNNYKKKAEAVSGAKKKEAVLAIYGDEDLHSEPLLQTRVSKLLNYMYTQIQSYVFNRRRHVNQQV